MNIVDSEIIKNRLKEHGFTETTNPLKVFVYIIYIGFNYPSKHMRSKRESRE